ncbi:MAG: GNAT family N-acetyltransferase, partial [Deltaproteobacteria bacterium]|nr:GNAT family N-acetyltransferase [Deltaproteobacteria bacterium]
GWQHQSYSWFNRGYETFDDYLALFNANQRRNIKRERRAMDKQGIVIKILTGDDIPRSHFDLMYRFYEHTNDKFGPWGCRYLTESFFEGLHDRFRHRLVFIAAYDSRAATLPVGMSMLVTKDKSLYGRYWGSTQKFDSLHFNACYYEPIAWAINHGIQRFDPGMGGAHKIRRGFTSLPSYSLHRFSDPRLLQIMQNHIDEINRLEQEQIDALNAELPFARRELEN